MYRIVYENHEVYEFAAEELSRYYAKISGEHLCRYLNSTEGEGIPIFLGSPKFLAENNCIVPTDKLKYDGYFLKVTSDGIFISGLEKRSVLYGVYRLLENAGCKWMFPGEDGEIIPQISNLKFSQCEIIDNPDFEVRASCDDTHEREIVDSYVVETMEKFDWACKNRLNSYFGGPSIHGDIFLSDWFLREITKRDFILEAGGHGTVNYVDKKLFDKNPELFRMKDGVRRADGNFCSSNKEAVQMVVDGIGNLIKKIPSIKRYHIWFADTYEGSWCECEKCKNLSAAEQCFQLVNAVAKAYPDLKIDFLLYHDSEDVSSIAEKIPENVCAEYAPRERCYAHSIADDSCERNKGYYARLKDAKQKFASIYPFEYYGDMILFNKMGVNMQKVIKEDFIDYKNLGVNAIKILMFNRYSWFAYKLNMITFARLCWDINADIMAIRDELCKAYFGNCYDYMMIFYEMQERFTNRMFEFCGYSEVFDIRNITPLNKEFGKKHLSDIEDGLNILSELEFILENAIIKADNIKVKRLLSSELACLDFTKDEAKTTYKFMKTRHAVAFEDLPKDEFNKIMDELINEKNALANKGKSVPNILTGINGKCTFPDHLCKDLSDFYNHLKNTPDDK
ncbi:MAG: DUF4838 domain-containing protein [Clostridia bacterium]|nr:DUF4838 domain-containing protein [Clostridia bacterium]